MATTTKKPAAKKTAPKAKSAAARPAAAKAKPAAARRTTKKTVKKTAAPRSFQKTGEAVPFLTFKPTVQTVYWLVLGVLVLALGAWVMYLNVKVQDIYDQIDANTNALDTPVMQHPVKKATHK